MGFVESAGVTGSKLLTGRILHAVSTGNEVEDLYVVVVDGEPLVFTEAQIQEMIIGAPSEVISSTLKELSKREKKSGEIRLLLFRDGEGEEMWFGHTKIPEEIKVVVAKIRGGKGN